MAQEKPRLITYIHPQPGSDYVTPQSSILIKFRDNIKNNLKSSDFHFGVFGEKSGLHTGETIISENTIIFKPGSIFKTSEKVFVSFIARILDRNNSLQFSFTTSNIKEFDARASAQRVLDAKLERNGPPYEDYSQIGLSLMSTQMQQYSFQFEMQHPSDYEARVMFNCGDDNNDLYFDNISLKEIVTSIVEETDFIFSEYVLNNNYPNPFNPTTKISFSIANDGFTILKIYDVLGNEIATLIKEELVAGKYDVDFSAIGGSASGGDVYPLPSGIYFYSLTVNNFRKTKKMVFLK